MGFSGVGLREEESRKRQYDDAIGRIRLRLLLQEMSLCVVHRCQCQAPRTEAAPALTEEAAKRIWGSGSGRVRQARLRGPRGSLVLSGSELRQRLGLKSTLVNFEIVTGGQSPPVELPVRRVTATARGGSRIDRITASVARQDAGRPPLLVAPPPLLVSKTSVRRWSSQGLQLLVKGQGYGHGVGMSQWGAHGLAEQGADFRSILQHYYRGAEVVPYRPHNDPSLALKLPTKPLWSDMRVSPFGTVSLSSAASLQ